MSWLDSVNRERERRGAHRLERCLLSLHADVFRVPWEDLVYPQLAGRPWPTPPSGAGDKESSARATRGLDSTTSVTRTDQSRAASESEDSEGEYVELEELPRFSPQRGSLTQSISLQHRTRTSAHRGFSSFGPPLRASPASLTPLPSKPAEPGGCRRTPEQQSEGGNIRCGTRSRANRSVCGEEKETSEAEEENKAQEATERPTEEGHEGHESVVEGKEKDKHERTRDGSLLPRNAGEEPDQMDVDGKGTDEEVEVEEEVCVTILHQGQEGRMEEQMERENNREEEQEKETTVEKVPESSCLENNTPLSGDFCSERSSERGHVNGFYSENKIPSTDNSGTLQTHSTAFSPEKIAEQMHTGGSYCESIPEANSRDSYSREKALPVQSHTEGSRFELRRTTGEENTSHVPHCERHIGRGNAQSIYCKSCTSREPEPSEECEGEQAALAAAGASPAPSAPAPTVPAAPAEPAPVPAPAEPAPLAPVPAPTFSTPPTEPAPVPASTEPAPAPTEPAPVPVPTVPKALAETAPVPLPAPIQAPTVPTAPEEPTPTAPISVTTASAEPTPAAPVAVAVPEAPTAAAEPAPVQALTVPTAPVELAPAAAVAAPVPTAPAAEEPASALTVPATQAPAAPALAAAPAGEALAAAAAMGVEAEEVHEEGTLTEGTHSSSSLCPLSPSFSSAQPSSSCWLGSLAGISLVLYVSVCTLDL